MGTEQRRVALITGGSRGIGAASALTLANYGFDVAFTYRNKAARATEVADEINQKGVHALAIGCDITKQDDVKTLFTTLKDWSDHLNLVVLNASGGLERDLIAITDMGKAIAAAAMNTTLPSGHTVVIGGSLESLPLLPANITSKEQ